MLVFFMRAKTVLAKSPWRMVFRTLHKSFEIDFDDCLSQIRRYRELIDAESHAASIILQVEESKEAEEERQRAEEERQQAEENRRRVQKLEAEAETRRKGVLAATMKEQMATNSI